MVSWAGGSIRLKRLLPSGTGGESRKPGSDARVCTEAVRPAMADRISSPKQLGTGLRAPDPTRRPSNRAVRAKTAIARASTRSVTIDDARGRVLHAQASSHPDQATAQARRQHSSTRVARLLPARNTGHRLAGRDLSDLRRPHSRRSSSGRRSAHFQAGPPDGGRPVAGQASAECQAWDMRGSHFAWQRNCRHCSGGRR